MTINEVIKEHRERVYAYNKQKGVHVSERAVFERTLIKKITKIVNEIISEPEAHTVSKNLLAYDFILRYGRNALRYEQRQRAEEFGIKVKEDSNARNKL